MMYSFLIVIIFILTAIIVFQNIKINKISNSLTEIIIGNFNERIKFHDYNKSVKNLIINLNRLIDKFQEIVSVNKQYEDNRKKMISNISHDLRTPLTSMLGYVEMLQTDKSLSSNEKKEYLDVIETKGEVLRRLIDEFFSLSKIDSDDIKFEVKKIDIAEITRQCLLSFLKDFDAREITPIIEIPEKKLYIDADEKSINRILQNIISNSLKYGSSGKVIGINLKENRDNVTIEIWDKGKGIKKEDLPYIFERLYTGEESRNSNLKGNGIGLTIVKKLVERHNGKIEVESLPYKKTAFKITFPKKLRKM
ncbi:MULTISPECIES: sensor histidine kinase [Clostridium]|uniref:sensor histidine kinase n=1 Tax=Clostridium TaxID=1485 RepID=UPI0009C01C01|nr:MULTISPECIES: HAMP domain-containing sensor histidine kinase [Clostridium]PJI07512.1 sensor histidine kinase [Clostridium sp. CT7]